MSRPNVLLVTIDTLRWDKLGWHRANESITPNLDRMAEGGVLFTQAITGGSWTQAAFPPMLTSTYASMFGGCLGPLSPSRPSPIEALSANGFHTTGFSTTPLLSKAYGYDRGFHKFYDLETGDRDPVIRRIKGGQTLLRKTITHTFSDWIGFDTRPARPYQPADHVVDRISGWLDDAECPFFVWAHFMDTHWPYHLDASLKSSVGRAWAWQDLAAMHRVNWGGGSLDDAQRQRFVELYEESVRFVDAQIGRLLQKLETDPAWANTMVIVVSDHGEEFLEREHWGHVEINLHDEIIRVPMVIRLPRGSVPVRVDRQVRTLDLMPTILEICGCPRPDGLQGESLTPLWSGNPDLYTADTSVSERWRLDSHMIAVRSERYKYIWDSKKSGQPTLYDLISDPEELVDVKRDCPAIADELHMQVEHVLNLADVTTPQVEVQHEEVDPATEARLRDLGYIE